MYNFTNYMLRTILITLCFIALGNISLIAQDPDPCVEGGYELSLSATPVACAGEETGVAVIASTGCSCVFSGCTFLWNNGETHHTIDSLSAGTYTVTVTHPDGCVMDTVVVVPEPELYVEEVQKQDVSCNGMGNGTAEVVPTETAGPLTYLWSNGEATPTLNNLTPGTYTVIVTNYINCQYISTVEITEPEVVELDIVATPSCGGSNTGSAEVMVLSGTGPFNYLWNDPNNCIEPMAQQLEAGSYTVSVTDNNNCTYTRTVEVQANPPANLEVNTTPACQGLATGSASINIDGGTSPFTYIWSNGQTAETATFLQVGAYEVTITDNNGCTYETSFEIPSQELATSASASASEICAGGTVNLLAEGGQTYSWYPTMGLDDPNSATPTATVNQSMNYTVTIVTADGCQDTQTLSINVLPAAEASINAWETTLCQGASTQLIAVENSGSGATFSWSPSEGLNNANSNAPVATPSETTTYTVTSLTANGCTATAEVTLTVEICSAIEETAFVNSLNVYPNPSSGDVFVAFEVAKTNEVHLNVYNTLGQVILTEGASNFAGTYQSKLNLNNVAKGLYYIGITIGNDTHLEKMVLH